MPNALSSTMAADDDHRGHGAVGALDAVAARSRRVRARPSGRSSAWSASTWSTMLSPAATSSWRPAGRATRRGPRDTATTLRPRRGELAGRAADGRASRGDHALHQARGVLVALDARRVRGHQAGRRPQLADGGDRRVIGERVPERPAPSRRAARRSSRRRGGCPAGGRRSAPRGPRGRACGRAVASVPATTNSVRKRGRGVAASAASAVRGPAAGRRGRSISDDAHDRRGQTHRGREQHIEVHAERGEHQPRDDEVAGRADERRRAAQDRGVRDAHVDARDRRASRSGPGPPRPARASPRWACC